MMSYDIGEFMKIYSVIISLILTCSSLLAMERETERIYLLDERLTPSTSINLPEKGDAAFTAAIQTFFASYITTGNNDLLNYCLERPDAEAIKDILIACFTYILQSTPEQEQGFSILEKINIFIKAIKLQDKNGALYRYWNGIQELMQAIDTYDKKTILQALSKYLKQYEGNYRYSNIFSTLQEELAFAMFVITSGKAHLNSMKSRIHKHMRDSKIKQFAIVGAVCTSCGVTAAIICLMIAYIDKNHDHKKLTIAGYTVLAFTLLNAVGAFARALVDYCVNREETPPSSENYIRKIQLLLEEFTKARTYLHQRAEQIIQEPV